MKKIQSFGIYANAYKDKGFAVTKDLVARLEKLGAAFYLDDGIPGFPDCGGLYFNRSELIKKSDVVLVVGGDGTMLNIISECAAEDVPVLGINLGNLGFLSEIEIADSEKMLSALTAGKYTVESRAMLSAEIGGAKYFALNEIVAGRNINDKVVHLDVYAGDDFIDRLVCDGVIVCTPTGSTAYSLSAGGPVLSPTLKALCITPISAHSLHSRPLVLDDSLTVRIAAADNRADTAVTADGEQVAVLRAGGELLVKRAEITAKFIRVTGRPFYYKLLKKLNKWSYTEE